MSNIVMNMQSFDSVDHNYNVNDAKLHIQKNSIAEEEFSNVANVKYNLAQRMNNYNLNKKKNVYKKAMGGVYGGTLDSEHIFELHQNDLNSTNNSIEFKNKIIKSQKNNSAFSRMIISQKSWEEFYGNYLEERYGKIKINTWQVHCDLKVSCEQYHKLIFINKFNKQNNLVNEKKINLQTHKLEEKLKTVGYDPKNFNFYFSQHTNTDNPHFHVVVWDKTLIKKDYIVHKNDLFEIKKTLDHKMYRQTKWKELNELVTRKNYLSFQKNVEEKNNFELLNLVMKNEFKNFRYQYLEPEQKKIIDLHFENYFAGNPEYEKIISNLQNYYLEEAKIKSDDKKKQNKYITEQVKNFLKPYKQIILNDIKDMTIKKNKRLLTQNHRKLQISTNKFVSLDEYLNKIFSTEYCEDNLKNIEKYLLNNKYNLQTTQKVLLSYLYKNKIEDKEIFKSIYNKFKIKNIHTKKVFNVIQETNKTINFETTYQIILKKNHDSYQKIIQYCDQNNLDTYTNLELQVQLTNQLLSDEQNKFISSTLMNKRNYLLEQKDKLNWHDVDKNNLLINTIEVPQTFIPEFDFENNFNKNIFLKSDIDKQIWKYVFKEKATPEKVFELRKYLVSKNYNLNTIEYVEKTFIEQKLNTKKEKDLKNLLLEHKQFWKKDLNEFISKDRILKDAYLNNNGNLLNEYLKNNNFDNQLCNWIINDFNRLQNDVKKLPKLASKITSNFDTILTLKNALNLSIPSQNKIVSYKDNLSFEFEKIISEFGINQQLKKNVLTKKNNKKKIQERKTNQVIAPTFNSKKTLNDMRNCEEELINNLSQQMWQHEQN